MAEVVRSGVVGPVADYAKRLQPSLGAAAYIHEIEYHVPFRGGKPSSYVPQKWGAYAARFTD
jgi:hypothetical protein